MAGFSSVTMPEYSVELRDVEEGNQPIPTRIVESGDVGTATFEKGTFIDDLAGQTFFDWVQKVQTGRTRSVDLGGSGIAGAAASVAERFYNSGTRETFVVTNLHRRVPVPHTWILYDALPVNHQPVQEMDADTSDVSIESIEVQPNNMEELALDDLPGPIGAIGSAAGDAAGAINDAAQLGGGGLF